MKVIPFFKVSVPSSINFVSKLTSWTTQTAFNTVKCTSVVHFS